MKFSREACDIPQPVDWPHRPVMVCANTLTVPDTTVPIYDDGPCPIGVPFQFETDLFVGSCLVRFKDVLCDDPDSSELYFRGRQRRFQSIIQGRFKESLTVSDVLTGHEFGKPLQRLPPKWLLNAGTSLIKRLAPGAEMDITSEKPEMLSILAATTQSLSVDMPGNEPLITSHDIDEDTTNFEGPFANGTVSACKRKKILANPTGVACQLKYDTDSIYTFDFYQHLLDVDSYSLNVGFATISIAPSMNGQPIQVMAKTRNDGRYLWNFQIWHETLLNDDEKKVKDSHVT